MDHCAGKPVKIVDIQEQDHKIKFYPERLDEILRNYKNHEVAVLAVAGEYRTGKSFLLANIARALNCNNLDDLDGPLKGWFKWQAGREKHTIGIDIWSEPIPINTNGVQRVLVLMDTQGVFDCKSTMRDNAVIFALSTLLSSTLVFNLSRQICEDDLQHLQLWIEYGKLALEEGTSKPFQELLFLVRDWEHDEDCTFGQEGGAEYIEDLLKVSNDQNQELKKLRSHIKECFADISCVLLPHPGKKISKKAFDGGLRGLDDEFIEHFKKFLHTIISEHISVKEVNGKALTGQDLIKYFQEYTQLLEGDTALHLKPQTIYEATVTVHNGGVVDKCIDMYRKSMEEFLNSFVRWSDSPPNQLTAALSRSEKEVLDYFYNKCMKTDNDNNRAKLEIYMGRIYEATAIEHNGRLTQKCRNHYSDEIHHVKSENYKAPGELTKRLDDVKAAVLESFEIRRIILEPSTGENREKLIQEMCKVYENTATIHNSRILGACTDTYRREVEKVTKKIYTRQNELTEHLNAIRDDIIMDFEKQHMSLERSANDARAKLKEELCRILEATAIKHNGELTEECLHKYTDLIDNAKSENYKAPGELTKKLDDVKAAVLESFEIRRIILEPSTEENIEKLIQEMCKIYEHKANVHNTQVTDRCIGTYRTLTEKFTMNQIREAETDLTKMFDDVISTLKVNFKGKQLDLKLSDPNNKGRIEQEMRDCKVTLKTLVDFNSKLSKAKTEVERYFDVNTFPYGSSSAENGGKLDSEMARDFEVTLKTLVDFNSKFSKAKTKVKNGGKLDSEMARDFETRATDLNSALAKEICHKEYVRLMELVTTDDQSTSIVPNNDWSQQGVKEKYVKPDDLFMEHYAAKVIVLKYFDMQCVEHVTSARESKELENVIDQSFKHIKIQNENNKPWYKTITGKVLIFLGAAAGVIIVLGSVALIIAYVPCIATTFACLGCHLGKIAIIGKSFLGLGVLKAIIAACVVRKIQALARPAISC